MVPATPHCRYQASLESVINSSGIHTLSPSERTTAEILFYVIISYYELHDTEYTSIPYRGYKRATLLRMVYQYAPSSDGRDNILRYSLEAMFAGLQADRSGILDFPAILAALNDFEDKTELAKIEVAKNVMELADDLVDNFFLPCKLLSAIFSVNFLTLVHNSESYVC